jgi:ribosome-associated translation inhibitor RaiA
VVVVQPLHGTQDTLLFSSPYRESFYWFIYQVNGTKGTSPCDAGWRRGQVELDILMVEVDHVDAFRAYLERRIRFALGRFSRSIRRVRLRVSHGVRGGVSTEVRITIGLLPSGRIVLIERASDLHAAIDRVVDRSARTIARRLDRRRSTGLERIMPGERDR